MTWTPSNLGKNSATNVTYVFSFKTATAGTIASVTMTVPNGTGHGTHRRGHSVWSRRRYGPPLASNTITYTVTTPVSVATGVPIYLSFTGLANHVHGRRRDLDRDHAHEHTLRRSTRGPRER